MTLQDDFRDRKPSDSSKRFLVVKCSRALIESAEIAALSSAVIMVGQSPFPVLLAEAQEHWVAGTLMLGLPRDRPRDQRFLGTPSEFAQKKAIWTDLSVVFEVPRAASDPKFPVWPCPE
jgi:hypothetical protein